MSTKQNEQKYVDRLLDIFATLQQPINIVRTNERGITFRTDHLTSASRHMLLEEFLGIYVVSTIDQQNLEVFVAFR